MPPFEVDRRRTQVIALANSLLRDVTQRKQPNGDINWANPEGRSLLGSIRSTSVELPSLRQELSLKSAHFDEKLRCMKDENHSMRAEHDLQVARFNDEIRRREAENASAKAGNQEVYTMLQVKKKRSEKPPMMKILTFFFLSDETNIKKIDNFSVVLRSKSWHRFDCAIWPCS
jgi:hypothetical protein